MSDKILKNQYYNFKGLYDKDDSGLIPSDPVETGVFAEQILNARCDDGTITFGLGYEAENDGSSDTTHYNGTDNTYIRNQYRLNRRDGQIIIVSQLNNGKLEWLNTVLNRYETLTTGLTADVDIGMVDFNKTDQDRTYYCDGVNNLSFWNKAIAYYASDNGSNTITVTVPNSAHTTLALAGFSSTGTLVLKDGTEITYTGLSTLTFTGCSAVPSSPTVGDGITQLPDKTTITSDNAKGRILFKYQGRMGVVLEASPTIIYLSKVADGEDWTVGSDPADPQVLNVIDGDGRINGVVPFKKRLVVLKEGGVIPVEIVQIDSTTLKLNIETLIEYPGIGPSAPGQIYTGINQMYWISPAQSDIKELTKIGQDKDIDLTASRLTTDIKNVMDDFTLGESKITFNKNNLYVSAKSSSVYDTVIQFDADRRTFYLLKLPVYGFWFDSNNRIHGTDPSSIKSYRLFSGYDADGASLQYLWKSGRLNFGTDFYKKETNLFAVFGKMTKSSTLACKIEYNSGALGDIEWEIKGDGTSTADGKYMLTTLPGSGYGNNPYGIVPYGGESLDVDLQYFLYFKSLPKGFRPYDVNVTFAAEGGDDFIKIISFGLNPDIRPEISKKRRT